MTATENAARSRPGQTSAAERMRRMRERRKIAAAPLLYERADWTLFVRPESLPQKAGCEPKQIGRVVLKELTDNSLDIGAEVTVERIPNGYRIVDDGPGIAPADVPRLFAVNRPLLSSKLKRLPLRGMLGNGLRVVMGAVAAYDGKITVTTRGHRLELSVDPLTGLTSIVSDAPIPVVPGTTVEISLRQFDGSERRPAELSVTVAGCGKQYSGPSWPAWYNVTDLRELLAWVTPAAATVAVVVRDLFAVDIDDERVAGKLTPDEVAELHAGLCRMVAGRRFEGVGHIGNENHPPDEYYGRSDGTTRINGTEIPYCIEAWVQCEHASKFDDADGVAELLLNRSPCLSPLYFDADSNGLSLRGCSLRGRVKGAKRGQYSIVVSVISPYVRLMNDGKTPFMGDFRDAVFRAVNKAAGAAYRAMVRPPTKMTIAKAARQVMEVAYMKASDGNTLPANARQIMYAARPDILRLAGVEKFSDNRFTQYNLPDFITANPELCVEWDVVFDARGHFREPHSDHREFGLGTLEVRNYVDDRPSLGPAVTFNVNPLYPTSGPKNRYRNVLFIEKEGFDTLLRQARIAERFDIAIMSTKGMSVTAARLLLDRLAPQIDRVFTLHDFDVTGFSISGTLGTDGRRYIYENAVEFIDLGLRLADAEAMDLQSEPVEVEGDRDARAKTLRGHGATEKEIAFLLGEDGQKARRVELNSMTSRQFIDFLDQKLTEHGVEKVVPDAEIIERHARRLVEQRLAKEEIDKIRDRLAKEAAARKLPSDLPGRVRKLLADRPELSWDLALALILQRPPALFG
jgi:hypothetical protein